MPTKPTEPEPEPDPEPDPEPEQQDEPAPEQQDEAPPDPPAPTVDKTVEGDPDDPNVYPKPGDPIGGGPLRGA